MLKLKRTENLGVPTLETASKMCSTDLEKAEAPNSQFQSVFIKDSQKEVKEKGISPYTPIPHLYIGVEGVKKNSWVT